MDQQSTATAGNGASRIPRLSVCLPTYNRAHYLGDAVRSMLAQTFSDFELIVSDNCSSDATPEIVRGFSDPRVHYVRQPRPLGHYDNMNAALALARGEYVCIVHDDDVYAPEFLAAEAGILDRHPSVGMVHCAVRLVDRDRRPLAVHRVAPQMRIGRGLDEFRRYLGGHDVCCSTVMCRRAVWQMAGPFQQELMCADWLMWLNVALRADVAYIASPLAEVRVHDASMTAAMDPMRWYDEFVEVTRRALTRAGELGVRLDPSADVLQRAGSRSQSRRFLIAALAAAATGADRQVEGYLGVLRKLQQRGASPVYWWIGRALSSRVARPALRAVRRLRRSWMRSQLAEAQ